MQHNLQCTAHPHTICYHISSRMCRCRVLSMVLLADCTQTHLNKDQTRRSHNECPLRNICLRDNGRKWYINIKSKQRHTQLYSVWYSYLIWEYTCISLTDLRCPCRRDPQHSEGGEGHAYGWKNLSNETPVTWLPNLLLFSSESDHCFQFFDSVAFNTSLVLLCCPTLNIGIRSPLYKLPFTSEMLLGNGTAQNFNLPSNISGLLIRIHCSG